MDPIRPSGPVRRFRRRVTDPRPEGVDACEQTPGTALEPARKTHFEPHEDRRRSAFAAFAAHLLGQSGQRRGLRGGPGAVHDAQTAYLDVEWSGPDDRRTPKGVNQKTEI